MSVSWARRSCQLIWDEFAVAGGLAGAPIHVVKARTVDLLVPAEAEVVIEGMIDTEYVEPEAPFGESHGHVALEEYNMPMRITAITHRRDAVIPSYISQVAPSESSVIKRVAYEPLFLSHLRDTLSIKGVKKVELHEPLTGLLRVTIITCEKGMAQTEVWRALNGAAFFKGDCGKICIAVNDDIKADNADAISVGDGLSVQSVRGCDDDQAPWSGARAQAGAYGGARFHAVG